METQDCVFRDLLNDDIKIENKTDTPIILTEEPRIDILKLKWEFSSVYLNNEIYYLHKIDQLNKEILFRNKIIEDLKTKLKIFTDLAVYYKDKYHTLFQQASDTNRTTIRLISRYFKRNK